LGPKVPKLPEKAADEPSNEEEIYFLWISLFEISQERSSSEAVVERLQKKDESHPDERETVVRNDHRRYQTEDSQEN
jgi:hypothetical protein